MTIRMRYSTSHLFFPQIIIGILVLLAICLVVQRILRCRREKTPFLPGGFRFFAPGYDKLKFYGSFVLFVLYILAMEWIGFLAASIVFIFLFNALFCATLRPKSLGVSALISVVSSVAVWYVFGVLFRITLP